jgi:hypothetical protein
MWVVAGRGSRDAAARRVISASRAGQPRQAAAAGALPVDHAPVEGAVPQRALRSSAVVSSEEYWSRHTHRGIEGWVPRRTAGAGWNNNFVAPTGADGKPYIPKSSTQDANVGAYGVVSARVRG